jgi:hypothetical protein
LHGEGGDGEFSSCFYFIPTIPFFLIIFSVKLLFSWPLRPPSLPQSREQGPATTIPAACCVEKVVMGSSPLVFIFPHHSTFSHSLFFQLNCYKVVAIFCCFSFSFLALQLNFTISLPAETYI